MAKLPALLRSPTRLARQALREWALRRQGKDPDPVTLHRRRVYIIPSGLGIGFGLVLFAMLLASMNYNSSMGFASPSCSPDWGWSPCTGVIKISPG